MITNKFDGVLVRTIITDQVTGHEDVWFPGWDVSRLLGKRIRRSDLLKSGMIEGKDFAYVLASDEVYRDLATKSERYALRLWRRSVAEADKTGRKTPSFAYGDRQRLLVSEAGFYQLVFASRSPFAAQMKRWLADEVIPSIRRHGRYKLPEDHPIWEVFTEMENELQMFHKVVENAAEKLTVADIIGTDTGLWMNPSGEIIETSPTAMEHAKRLDKWARLADSIPPVKEAS